MAADDSNIYLQIHDGKIVISADHQLHGVTMTADQAREFRTAIDTLIGDLEAADD